MGKYMYIAYGSNLHFEQMKFRCPNSIYMGSGYLKNAELLFRGTPGNCFCTVDLNKKGKKVPIGIFIVDDTDLINLDRYEGYPIHYRREMIKPKQMEIISWMNKGIKLVDSIIYIMNRGYYGAPSERYMQVVLEGYENCNLDKEYLDKAYRKSIKLGNAQFR